MPPVRTAKFWNPRTDVEEGYQAQRALREFGIKVDVLPDEVAEQALSRGEFDVFIMGCKCVSIDQEGELELVDSYQLTDFPAGAAQSRRRRTAVIVVVGDTKFMPRDQYTSINAGIVKAREAGRPADLIVSGQNVTWWVTQKGVFSSDEMLAHFATVFYKTPYRFPAWQMSELARTEKDLNLELQSIGNVIPDRRLPYKERALIQFDEYLKQLDHRLLSAPDIAAADQAITHLRRAHYLTYLDSPVDLGVKVLRKHLSKRLDLPETVSDAGILDVIYDLSRPERYYATEPESTAAMHLLGYRRALNNRIDRLLGPRFVLDFSGLFRS